MTPGRVSFGRTRQVYMYRESPQERAQKLAAAAPALARAGEIRAENERLEDEATARQLMGAPAAEGAIAGPTATSAALLSALVAAKSEMLSALEASPAVPAGGGAERLPSADLLMASTGSHGYEHEDLGMQDEGGQLDARDAKHYFQSQRGGAEDQHAEEAPRDISDDDDDECEYENEADSDGRTLRDQVDRLMDVAGDLIPEHEGEAGRDNRDAGGSSGEAAAGSMMSPSAALLQSREV